MTQFYSSSFFVLCLIYVPLIQAWSLPQSWRTSVLQPRDYNADDGDLPEKWLTLLSDTIVAFEPIGDTLASFLGIDIAASESTDADPATSTTDSMFSDLASCTASPSLASSVFTLVAPPEITTTATPISEVATSTPAVASAVSAPKVTFSLRDNLNVIAYFGTPVDPSASLAQLDALCRNPIYDVIILSSLISVFEPTTSYPLVNIGAGCDYTNPIDTSIDGTPLPDCKALGAQVALCQGLGKKIVLGLDVEAGELGFASTAAARAAAMELWHLFGRASVDSGDARPLGYLDNDQFISVDGFEVFLEKGSAAGDYLDSHTEAFFDALQNYYTLNETAPNSLLSVSLDVNSLKDLAYEALHYVDWVTIRYSDADLLSEGNKSGWLATLAGLINSLIQTVKMTVLVSITSTPTPTELPTAEVSLALAIETDSPEADPTPSAPFTPPIAALFPGNTFISAQTDIPVPNIDLQIPKSNADTTFATVFTETEVDTPTATEFTDSPGTISHPTATSSTANAQRLRKRDIFIPLLFVGGDASLFDDRSVLPGYLMDGVDAGTIRGFAVSGTAEDLASEAVGRGIVRGMQK